uniref:EAL domain-containing protein n=1 Tax=Ningiella ruwaisensis TaxID=2364274 RepID=UPI0010A0B32D|nr:EAL domain-containing protein [Ningiella ruwaisensis]
MNCEKCIESKALAVDISMAFQPIVDLHTFSVYGYEALVRTASGGGAAEVFNAVPKEDIYSLDQACRVKAIELAASLGIDTYLSINFMPNAVYEPSRCIAATLRTAKKVKFPIDKIIFEFTETESVYDTNHVISIINDYQSRGFQTAIDDFGAGYSGIKLLCDVHTDIVKIDRSLIINIDSDPRRQRIVKDVKRLLDDNSNKIIVEGVESIEEIKMLYAMGFRYFQGFYFAKPGFEHLPEVDFDTVKTVLTSSPVSQIDIRQETSAR